MKRINNMKRLLIALFLLSSFFQMSGQKIIPQPLCIENREGAFQINPSTKLAYGGAEAEKSAVFFNDYLKQYFEISLDHTYNDTKGCIVLSIERREGAKKGAYTLEVTPDRIKITGYNQEGLFYGVQTLIQLLPESFGFKLDVPACKIDDEPRFAYRGMHLDCVRHIFPISFVKRYIDYLALHKLNYFHWHLTDDQGWRMESKSHPKLNTLGAWRDSTIIGTFPGVGIDPRPYGGYYTVEQMKEVVEYAAQRYITVIPEIDVPGHSMAILATYPSLGTDPAHPIRPAITWNIYNRQNNVLAPRDETFKFLDDVFNELMDVFPGPYIHIGADECSHKWWKSDPLTQEFIKDNNLGDEKGLQRYFSAHINDVVRSRGRVAVGWDEVIDFGMVEGLVPMVWRNAENVKKAVEKGYDVILTPSPYSYMNHKQREDEPYITYPAGMITLEKVYSFEPVPEGITEELASHILGGQGCMWAEYYETPQRIDYSVLPRMSAISEIYWSAKNRRSWEDFHDRLQRQFSRYELWNTSFCDFERRFNYWGGGTEEDNKSPED